MEENNPRSPLYYQVWLEIVLFVSIEGTLLTYLFSILIQKSHVYIIFIFTCRKPAYIPVDDFIL